MRSGEIITTPFFGAGSTVEAIRSAILAAQTDFTVRRLAENIVRELRSKDYLSEAIAVYNYVWANSRYCRDPRTIELVKEVHIPAGELLRGEKPQIDCDDMTALIGALVLVLGGQCQIVTVAFQDIRVQGEQQFSHVFIQVREPRSGGWITLDPVAGPRTKEMLHRVKIAKVWAIA